MSFNCKGDFLNKKKLQVSSWHVNVDMVLKVELNLNRGAIDKANWDLSSSAINNSKIHANKQSDANLICTNGDVTHPKFKQANEGSDNDSYLGVD
jgi:hypothetical protein